MITLWSRKKYEEWERDFCFFNAEQARNMTDSQMKEYKRFYDMQALSIAIRDDLNHINGRIRVIDLMRGGEKSFKDITEALTVLVEAGNDQQSAELYVDKCGELRLFVDGAGVYRFNQEEDQYTPLGSKIERCCRTVKPGNEWIEPAIRRMREDPSFSLAEEFAKQNGIEYKSEKRMAV